MLAIWLAWTVVIIINLNENDKNPVRLIYVSYVASMYSDYYKQIPSGDLSYCGHTYAYMNAKDFSSDLASIYGVTQQIALKYTNTELLLFPYMDSRVTHICIHGFKTHPLRREPLLFPYMDWSAGPVGQNSHPEVQRCPTNTGLSLRNIQI